MPKRFLNASGSALRTCASGGPVTTTLPSSFATLRVSSQAFCQSADWACTRLGASITTNKVMISCFIFLFLHPVRLCGFLDADRRHARFDAVLCERLLEHPADSGVLMLVFDL